MLTAGVSWRTPALALLAVALPGAAAVAKTKIACVGASTTSGDGSSAGHHYPDELQRLVAPDAEVRNFGVSGTTMLRNVSATYWTTMQLTQALAYQPDIAIIWFGGNDAKPENWTTHKGEFLGDYEAMVRMFQGLPSHARTYVVLSLLTRDTEGIPKAVVDNEVIPLVRQAAAETGSGVVDVHDDLADHPEYFPDGIHPDDQGTVAVAKLVYAVISAPAADGGVDAPGATDASAADAPAAAASDAGPPDAGSTSGTGGVAAPATGVAGAPGGAGSAAPGQAGAGGGAPGTTSSGGAGAGGATGSGAPAHATAGGGCDLAGRAHGPSDAMLAALLLAGALARRRRFATSSIAASSIASRRDHSGGPP
jgi:lysophospholipase L1-like esterase